MSAEFIRRFFFFGRENPQVSQNQVQGAKCGVQFLGNKIFSAVREHCPPEKLPFHRSPIAIRCRLASLVSRKRMFYLVG